MSHYQGFSILVDAPTAGSQSRLLTCGGVHDRRRKRWVALCLGWRTGAVWVVRRTTNLLEAVLMDDSPIKRPPVRRPADRRLRADRIRSGNTQNDGPISSLEGPARGCSGSDPLFVFSRRGGCGRVSKWHVLYAFNFRVQSSMAGATLDGRHASRIGRTVWLRHPDTVRGLLGRGEAAMTGSAKLRKESGQLRREIQHQTGSMPPICRTKHE